MAKRTSGPLLPPETLENLYRDVFPDSGPDFEKANLIELADMLSKLGHREEPWGWKYLSSILRRHKGVYISPALGDAIQRLGRVQDGISYIQAQTVEITAFSINGNVPDGYVILGAGRKCEYELCQLKIVPKVPWQKYCCRKHRQLQRKLNARLKN